MAKRGATPEAEWQNTLVDLLQTFGYIVEHTYRLRTRDGWRTGSTLRGKPDLMAIRIPRVLAIECKRDGEYPTRAQKAVLTLYSHVPCARAWVLRPRDDFDMITAWVRRPATAPAHYGFEPLDPDDAARILAPGAHTR